MSREPTEMEERVAKALTRYDMGEALKHSVFDTSHPTVIGAMQVVVDTKWEKMLPLARIAIRSMREVTQGQADALSATDKMWKDLNSQTVWQTYIDAASPSEDT